MKPKKKQSLPPSQLPVEIKVDDEITEVIETKEDGHKIIPPEPKKIYPATGKFYAEDGFVIGKEGKVVSKKMNPFVTEDIAKKFNK